MNIKEIHTSEKSVSASLLFKNELASVTAIQILKGEKLKEHVSKIPALLLCIEGKAIYGSEGGINEILLPGDYVKIEPMVTHWVEAEIESQLVLIK